VGSGVLKDWVDAPSTVLPILTELMAKGLRVWLFRLALLKTTSISLCSMPFCLGANGLWCFFRFRMVSKHAWNLIWSGILVGSLHANICMPYGMRCWLFSQTASISQHMPHVVVVVVVVVILRFTVETWMAAFPSYQRSIRSARCSCQP
jgi:hypothetical protein